MRDNIYLHVIVNFDAPIGCRSSYPDRKSSRRFVVRDTVSGSSSYI